MGTCGARSLRRPIHVFRRSETSRRESTAKYDVIIYPARRREFAVAFNGIPKAGPIPIPYKKIGSDAQLGPLDQSDDIRGGMGMEGLAELAKFVQQGGTLITEGSTSRFLADYGLAGASAWSIRPNCSPADRSSVDNLRISRVRSPTVTIEGYSGLLQSRPSLQHP